MTTHKNSPRANQLPGPNGRPNGHDPASTPDSLCPSGRPTAGTERGGASSPRSRAASDDASGPIVASSTAFPAAGSLQPQAGTNREAYAAAAPPAPEEFAELANKPNGSAKAAPSSTRQNSQDEDTPEIPPGTEPLPETPGEFVEEIHRRADLFAVWLILLKSKDPKIQQRAAEKLTEMRYKGVAALADEPPQFVVDMPRPQRD